MILIQFLYIFLNIDVIIHFKKSAAKGGVGRGWNAQGWR